MRSTPSLRVPSCSISRSLNRNGAVSMSAIRSSTSLLIIGGMVLAASSPGAFHHSADPIGLVRRRSNGHIAVILSIYPTSWRANPTP
jgi:hypothetical protein